MYNEKIELLDGEEFFNLFDRLNAAPRWVTSNGKKSIQILGLCHGGTSHSALFDPSTLKVNCFAGHGGMMLHTWIMRALDMDSPQKAKDFLVEWLEDEDIDLTDRVPIGNINFERKAKPYSPTHIEPVESMPQVALGEIYSDCDIAIETLARLVWHKEDGIPAEILKEFDVAYYPPNGTILLPHHNINGEIVGIYERNFLPLRKFVKDHHPDMPHKMQITYPRAKYVPLLRDEKHQRETKTSWSFPNSENLYGLHKAQETIKKTGIAFVFEGAKSVMLARHYGYSNAVATHTYGIHENHISMLIECGAKEIVLGFDKQYQDTLGIEWELFERKTKGIAEKAKNFVCISRLIDTENQLEYKDSPADKGKDVFEKLFLERKILSEDEATILEAETEHEAAAIEPQETYQNPDGSYTYDGLTVKLQENSSNFILPQFCGEEETAYEVIKHLAGEQHFKAYKTKMNFPSGKLDLLSYTERSRAGFDFRYHYKMPPILENADAIAAFIEMAISRTENRELKTNWNACLEVTSNNRNAAASLFVGYGWAKKYDKEFPRVENAFYIVERRNGARHYRIVEDSIERRFQNIEKRACSADILYIIGNHRLSRTVKNNQLQAILKPLLWWDKRENNNAPDSIVRLSLTAAAIEECDRRISEYINNLLTVTACTYEHISRIKIDKSDLEFEFAAPHEFTISIEDIEFIEYRRSDVAKRNQEDSTALAEARGMNKSRIKFDLLKGDRWDGNELQALGYTRQQIKNYCTYGWIKVVGKNGKTPIYERVTV